jgi:uncharacterized protein YjbI with pentapeptide repeats
VNPPDHLAPQGSTQGGNVAESGQWHAGASRGDVFPEMESAAIAGLLIGGFVATLLAWRNGHDVAGGFASGLLGMIAGAVIGALIAAQWAATARIRGMTAPPRAGREQTGLWDHWLDAEAVVATDPGIRFVAEELGPELVPERAAVRPRVILPERGESMRLEDEVLDFAQRGDRGAIRIDGPAGSGKTTALRHLAAVLPRELAVCVLDEPDGGGAIIADRAPQGLVVYTGGTCTVPKHLATFRMADWGEDEWIEYLLATARLQGASVMARLKRAADRDTIEGNPELWRIVLDRMAGDATILSVRGALRRELAARLIHGAARRQVAEVCLARLTNDPARVIAPEPEAELASHGHDARLLRLIRHRPIQLLLAAERIVADLAGCDVCDYLAAPLPRDLVQEAGPLITRSTAAIGRLHGLLASSWRQRHPMAASLLHAAEMGWQPRWGDSLRLAGAYLEGASWPGIDLHETDLAGADLSRADLAQARLDGVKADTIRLHGAILRRALLERASVQGAEMSAADLGSVRGAAVNFGDANLEGADLAAASLPQARFCGANLARARFAGADLAGADLRGAEIAGADFTGANLDSAVLKGLTLGRSCFKNACFPRADLSRCDLEGMELPRAVFREAILHHALLTGSHMPDADFHGASLRQAGLAEVEWEGACLAGADLRLATFHLGTTRSGLVGSPIACEGSRTGFYTDDFDAQDYKPPEEIRKANLRGADLRGARIDDVDFYLVDLRGALFDPHQAEHFRRCGAILEDRCQWE